MLTIQNPQNKAVNQAYNAVEVSYTIWKTYMSPTTDGSSKRHWNSHVYATTKAANHDHGWNESTQSVDHHTVTGYMRMGWDLLFCLELYRQLRAMGDTTRETEVGSPLKTWANQLCDWINETKTTSGGWNEVKYYADKGKTYSRGTSHPWIGICLNLFSQMFEHYNWGTDTTMKNKIKTLCDDMANAIYNYEVNFLIELNVHKYNAGTAVYVDDTIGETIVGVPREQDYATGVVKSTGENVKTDILSVPHRHNGFCLAMGGLGKYAYHVYRYTKPLAADFIYRSTLIRMATYAASLVMANGGVAQGGTMAGDEGTWEYTYNGKKVRFFGAANIDTLHYNMYSLIGMEWAGHGITYTPQYQRPSASVVTKAESAINRYSSVVTALQAASHPSPFPNSTFHQKSDATAWNDVNALYRVDLDAEYDHHVDEANVPYMYAAATYFGQSYQTFVDKVFKAQGILEQLEKDHDGVDTSRSTLAHDYYTFHYNEQQIWEFSAAEGGDTLANRQSAVWGRSKETAFHRGLMGLIGAMEKGLTIYG